MRGGLVYSMGGEGGGLAVKINQKWDGSAKINLLCDLSAHPTSTPTDPPSDRENGHLPAENGRPRTTYPAGQLHREQGLKDARIG